jgi:glycine/D-amino acid oxidase-like deaminating enzyme
VRVGAGRGSAVVVGAGIIGCSTALELARTGWSVTVVDKGGAPGCGSTSASSAMIRFNYDHLDEAALAWEAAARWNDWERHLGVVDPAGMARFVRTGLLVLDGELSDRDRMLGFMRTLGIGFEELDAEGIRRRFPALDPARLGPACRVEDDHFWDEPSGELAGFFQPDSGHVDDAMLAAHNLAHAAEHHGAAFRWRAAVTSVLRDGGRVAGVGLADGSTVSADVVVNAAGPWSAGLNELAGVLDDFTSSTRAVEQEVVSLPAPPGFGLDDGGTGVHDPDFATYFRPHAGGSVIVGSFEPPCDPLVFVPDADAVAPSVHPETWELQSLRLARRLPGLQIPNSSSGIVSAYDVTDDWVPTYDRTNLDGYYVAIGTSGHQFKAAPFVGEVMATLVGAVESGHDHDADPLVVRGSWTGVEVSLVQFSRLRPVEPHVGMR